MALSTKWVARKTSNPVTAAWLNDVDDLVYTIFGGGSPTAGNTASQLLWITASDTISMGSAATSASTALFELNSTTKGFLPPRHTTAQRDLVSAPAEGLQVWNTTTKSLNVYNGTAWDTIETPWTVSGADISYTAGNTTISDLIVTTTATFSGATIANLGTVTTANIDGGTLDGVTIGGATPAAGTFTALTATGAFTSLGINDDADATAITISSSENVNVGGTHDNYKLQVHNPAAGSDNYIQITNDDTGTTTTDGLLIGIDTSEVAYIANFENTDLVFQTNGPNNRGRFDNAGRFMVGQDSATQQVEITAGAGREALKLIGASGQYGLEIAGNTTSGMSYGAIIAGGSNSSDYAFVVRDAALTQNFVRIRGDGKTHFGGAAPQGTVHIETSSAGAITPNTSYDDLVIENSADGGINILVGTTSNGGVYIGDSGGASQGYLDYDNNTDGWVVGSNNTDRMHIITGMYMQGATGGDQGAGTGNFTALYVNGVAVSANDPLQLSDNNATTPTYSFSSDTDTGWFLTTTATLSASAAGTERFRVSDTAVSCYEPLNVNISTNGQTVATFTQAGTTGLDGIRIDFSAASPDDNTATFLLAEDSTAVRCYIWSDGDLANHDGTYGTISDARDKTVLGSARDYWEDWKKLNFVNYEMHASPGKKMFGLVAQEVEQVFPGCVADGAYTPKDDTDPRTTQKFVKSSILHTIQGKVIQELIAKVEALEAKLGA